MVAAMEIEEAGPSSAVPPPVGGGPCPTTVERTTSALFRSTLKRRRGEKAESSEMSPTAESPAPGGRVRTAGKITPRRLDAAVEREANVGRGEPAGLEREDWLVDAPLDNLDNSTRRVRRSLRLARLSRSPKAPTMRRLETPGQLGDLPPELVEVILAKCDSRALARLNATAAFFPGSGITEVAARQQLRSREGPYSAMRKVVPSEGWMQLLRFVELREGAGLGGQGHKAATGPVRGGGFAAALGSYHSALLWRDGAESKGRLLTAGRGFHGQLGQDSYDNCGLHSEVELWDYDEGSELVDGHDDVEVVACGASHSACVTRAGALYTWGLASSGELGHGGWTPIEVNVPRQVSIVAGVRVVDVACGANHTLVVSEEGRLWSCGRGRHGQLGHGNYHDQGPLSPVEALKDIAVASVTAGKAHSMALTKEGSVYSWGDNLLGQLGHGGPALNILSQGDGTLQTGIAYPRKVEALEARFQNAPERIISVACGGRHSAALTVCGHLYTWGKGEDGALGLGSRENARVPTRVQLTTRSCSWGEEASGPDMGLRCVKVACGANHTVVLLHNPSLPVAQVASTGSSSYGQLGHGSCDGLLELRPVRALQDCKVPVTDISAGHEASSATTADGRHFLWGRGEWGQLGSGDERSHWRPVAVNVSLVSD